MRHLSVVVALVFLLPGLSHLSGQVIAITAGTLISPADGSETINQTILVEAGKIKEVGAGLRIPDNAIRIDLSGEAVLPGLIDAHTHLLSTVDPKWDLGDFWIMALQRRPAWRAIQGVRHAKEMLESGFTSVRDMGNAGDYLDADLAKAIRFEVVPGPRMIYAGRIIAPFGGQFWDTPADPKLLENPEYRFADSRDEMRKAVRENIYWGAGVIKIAVDSQKYSYSADDDWKRTGLWNLLFAAGILIGGFLASHWAASQPVAISDQTRIALSQLGIHDFSGLVPSDLFSWSGLLTLKGFVSVVVGGFLVGFGAAYAGGCTSGHAISGLADLQLPSLIATLGFFAGGLIATHWILPLLF